MADQIGTPDMQIIEDTWLARLDERGLPATCENGVVQTGIDGFTIARGETQAISGNIDEPGLGAIHAASVEMKVRFSLPDHPDGPCAVVNDQITMRGASMDEALFNCANMFMDVTFPPIATLFTGERPTGPGTGNITICGYRPHLDKGYLWDAILGPCIASGEHADDVAAHLTTRPPVTLIFNVLPDYAAIPPLHVIRIFGSQTQDGEAEFRVMIDNERHYLAEALMAENFEGPVPGAWEFRQMIVMHCTDEADEETMKDLRIRLGVSKDGRPVSWWRRLFI